MKFVKKFETESAFNNFKLNDTNTPNISLIEELYATGGIKYTQYISHDYSEDYFAIKALQNCSISIDLIAGNEPDSNMEQIEYLGELCYSFDNGQTWSEGYGEIENLNIPAGTKVLFKGSMQTGAIDSSQPLNDIGGWIKSTGNYEVEGNIMSLFYGDNFENQLSIDYNHLLINFFKDDIYLINAQHLILPATDLENHCYQGMFEGCTNLLTAPELPAAILDEWCYANMFKNCTSLTTAPELLASTLEEGCYDNMFYGCSSLNYIKCLAEYRINSDKTNDWVKGVSNNGTFICIDENTYYSHWNDIPSYDCSIPSNWNVEYEIISEGGGGDDSSQDSFE